MQPLTRSRPRPRFFGTSGPSFALDFVNGTNALDPRVTFTRASSATYFDSAGVLQSAANDVPRFDYNPATLAAQGLLIEEARTNSIRNNTMQGAVAGTPGTAPTNWALGGISGGLATQIVGTGAEDGIAYIDIRIFGTNSSGSSVFPGVFFDTTTGIAGTTGQVWAPSIYLKLAAGTGVNFDVAVHEADSGGVFLRSVSIAGTSGIPTTGALKTQRRSGSVTLGASTAFVRPLIATTVTNGTSVDFTLRIGLPQLELGAFATSVIPTTTTSLTRSADVASVTTLSPWYNASEGTLFAQGILVGGTAGAFPRQAALVGSNVNDDSIDIFWNAPSGNIGGGIRKSGANEMAQSSAPTKSAGSTFKAATAYKTNDANNASDGNVGTTDTTVALPTVQNLRIGGQAVFQPTASSWIQRIAYYNTRLPNAQLQALTAP